MPQIGTPQNVNASLSTDTSALVTWSVGLTDNPVALPGPPSISIKDNHGGIEQVGSTADSAVVNSLQSGTSYTFTVVFFYTSTVQTSGTSNSISTPGGGSGGGSGSTAKPSVTSATSTYATVNSGCRIYIDWSSSSSYTNCLLRYSIEGQPQIQQEGAGGSSGFFDFNASPGQTYQFALEGDNSWPNTNPNSGWTEPYTIVAAPNTTSLRNYLDGVDASQGLRALMKGGLSVRAFMQL